MCCTICGIKARYPNRVRDAATEQGFVVFVMSSVMMTLRVHIHTHIDKIFCCFSCIQKCAFDISIQLKQGTAKRKRKANQKLHYLSWIISLRRREKIQKIKTMLILCFDFATKSSTKRVFRLLFWNATGNRASSWGTRTVANTKFRKYKTNITIIK